MKHSKRKFKIAPTGMAARNALTFYSTKLLSIKLAWLKTELKLCNKSAVTQVQSAVFLNLMYGKLAQCWCYMLLLITIF